MSLSMTCFPKNGCLNVKRQFKVVFLSRTLHDLKLFFYHKDINNDTWRLTSNKTGLCVSDYKKNTGHY